MSHLGDLRIRPTEDLLHPPRDATRVLALPEVFVQLSCINLLRRHAARLQDNHTYDKSPAFQGSEAEIMHRADLCIERLRETVMCWADLSSIVQLVITAPKDNAPRSAIDLASKHKCRNFNAVAKWTDENAIKAVRMKDMWWGGRVFY